MLYKKVLVAIDGSEISQLALQEAVRLTSMLEATLCIVHGIDAVTTNAYKRTDQDEFLAPNIQTGHELLERAASSPREAGLQWEQRLLEVDTMGRSRLSEVIVREADDWEADLIVVGTHGRRGMSHLLLGSVAEDIVRITSKPVLVVPDKAAQLVAGSGQTYTNLMVAVDGTETSAPALHEAIQLAQDLNLRLRVVYAVADENGDGAATGNGGATAGNILEAAEATAREAGVEAQTSLLASTRQASAIAEAVAEDASAWPAHLVVLATHGRQGLDRLRMGSVAEAILRVSPAPVLLVRAAALPES